ncbi:MAG: HAD family hydrolase [Ilumatobacteraceae bacterium]
MGSTIELVVTDLDGTLWGVDRVVHPRALAALQELERRGVPVLVATARRSGPVRQLLAHNGLRLPAVLLDGAVVRDRSWTTIHVDAFEPATAAAVLDGFRRHDIEPTIGVLTDDERDARLGPRPSTHPDHVAYLADWSRRADLDAVVADEVVQSFSVCGVDRGLVQPIADDLATLAAPILSWDAVYDAYTLTVGPIGVHKWRGIQAFCAHHGLDDRAVLAIGDGLNDVEMLRAAAVACVVDGSDAQVLACAHHLVDGPATGGWADILAHVG